MAHEGLCNHKLLLPSIQDAQVIMLRTITRNLILRTVFIHKYWISWFTAAESAHKAMQQINILNNLAPQCERVLW